MIKDVTVKIIGAVNKNLIHEIKGLSPEEANLIVPTDGYFRLYELGVYDYKVQQIVKEVFGTHGDISVVVNVFVNKISNSDYYLVSNPMPKGRGL